jgi:pimeloyl-ACP methyl ester carboxylesterase
MRVPPGVGQYCVRWPGLSWRARRHLEPQPSRLLAHGPAWLLVLADAAACHFRDSYVDRSHFSPRPVPVGDWLRPAPHRLWWNQVARRLDYSARLSELGVPTLVLAGRHDPQMPVSCSEALARGIVHSRLVIFEHSGHYPFIEEPAAFWAVLGVWLCGDDPQSERPPRGAIQVEPTRDRAFPGVADPPRRVLEGDKL